MEKSLFVHRLRLPQALSRLIVAAAVLAVPALPHSSPAAEIVPFHTSNQSPLVQIFGLPPAERASLLPRGKVEGTVAVDIANNFATDSHGSERILLDGETYRATLAMRYGVAESAEVGLDVPVAGQGGGIFDRFIEGWHDFFHLPDEGRQDYPRNRLLFSYTKGSETRLHVDDSDFGLGDIRLSGVVQLYHDRRENPTALALRGSIKLPTGNSNRLHGSGSTDFALWLTGSDDFGLSIGHATLFGAAGGMIMTPGNVLRDQQNTIVGFGSLGAGWAPVEWIAFKTEVSGHTAFFHGSDLRELSSGGLQLLIGGTVALPGDAWLDIGVSEDIAVNTSPDVALHLAVRKVF